MGCEWWLYLWKGCGRRCIPLCEEEKRDTGGRTEGGPNHHRRGKKYAKKMAKREGEGVRRRGAWSVVHLNRSRWGRGQGSQRGGGWRGGRGR